MFLPKGSSVLTAIEHGEFAILAQALAAGSINVLLEGRRSLASIKPLVTLNIGVLLAGLVVLAGVVGGAGHLPPNTAVIASVWLLGLAVLIGLWSNWHQPSPEKRAS
jgi:hypothetical protein